LWPTMSVILVTELASVFLLVNILLYSLLLTLGTLLSLDKLRAASLSPTLMGVLAAFSTPPRNVASCNGTIQRQMLMTTPLLSTYRK
jgi:hypothetical protein